MGKVSPADKALLTLGLGALALGITATFLQKKYPNANTRDFQIACYVIAALAIIAVAGKQAKTNKVYDKCFKGDGSECLGAVSKTVTDVAKTAAPVIAACGTGQALPCLLATAHAFTAVSV